MSKIGLWLIAGVAIATLIWLVYLAASFEPPGGTTTVVVDPPIVTEPPPEPPLISPLPTPSNPATVSAAADDDVVVAAPPEEIATPPEPPPDEQLPSLNDSDSFVLEKLRAFSNGLAIIEFLASEQLIRRFVVFTHNVSEGELPQTDLPYRRVSDEMPVRTVDENLFEMDDSAHRRFNRMVDAFVALDTNQAVALYRLLSPLFQNAYAEIGFRRVDFDDTLQQAINQVLNASPPDGPFQLVKPSVMYLYADSTTEDLQAIDKQLIRLGPENTQKLRAKLREFSNHL
ncbi:MAG: DUF3014 domain-containing protein [Pseudohongiellaceae bacterium]